MCLLFLNSLLVSLLKNFCNISPGGGFYVLYMSEGNQTLKWIRELELCHKSVLPVHVIDSGK